VGSISVIGWYVANRQLTETTPILRRRDRNEKLPTGTADTIENVGWWFDHNQDQAL